MLIKEDTWFSHGVNAIFFIYRQAHPIVTLRKAFAFGVERREGNPAFRAE